MQNKIDTQPMTPEQLLFWLKGILDAETNNRRVPTHLIRESVEASFKAFTTARIRQIEPQLVEGPFNSWAGNVTLAKTPTL